MNMSKISIGWGEVGNLQHCASYKQVRKVLKINGFREKLARNLQQNQVTVKADGERRET